MSGTLRDEHYIEDAKQIQIRNELRTLLEHMENTQLISMDSIINSDLHDYIETTYLIPTGVEDENMMGLSMELDATIEEQKHKIIEEVAKVNQNLAAWLTENPNRIFNTPLPIEDEFFAELMRGYFVRKYLWGLPGDDAKKHLFSYNIDKEFVYSNTREVPGKFHVCKKLALEAKKTVILCSYLATVDMLEQMFEASGVNTIKITGQIAQTHRDQELQQFRESDEQMVAILSNVGERDLDIPEAELLIVFDLVRTTKTVYQKLKRTRGGTCRVLYYYGTEEVKKAKSTVKKMLERYPWSTQPVDEEIY